MYRAIQVKWLAPTNSKPSRYKAFTGDHQITRSYDYNGDDKARIAVAKELANKLGWYGDWYGGSLPNGDYAFVMSGLPGRDPLFVSLDPRKS